MALTWRIGNLAHHKLVHVQKWAMTYLPDPAPVTPGRLVSEQEPGPQPVLEQGRHCKVRIKQTNRLKVKMYTHKQTTKRTNPPQQFSLHTQIYVAPQRSERKILPFLL